MARGNARLQRVVMAAWLVQEAVGQPAIAA